MKIAYLLLLSRCTPNYTIMCSFLHAHYTITLKVIEKFVKNVYGDKHSFIELTYVVGAPTSHVTEIKEIYFEIYTKQVSCPLALPLLNISNCQSVLKYISLYNKLFIYLHDSYITKFDFMNYAFAKLLLERLYIFMLLYRIPYYASSGCNVK